jgi:hypothetical protein
MKPVPLLLLALAAPLAHADDEALRRCRGLADAGARLACYDALPLAAAVTRAATPQAPAAAAVPAVPAPPARTMAAIAPLPDTPAPPRPAPLAADPAAAAAAFGLDRARTELAELASTIPGTFEGWGPRTRIRLANGQVWQVSDDSVGEYYLNSPRVTIRRAPLGGYVMEIEGARRMAKVRRVE